jgi:hypothetical protein
VISSRCNKDRLRRPPCSKILLHGLSDRSSDLNSSQ